MKTLAITNNKGGVGKTTTAINVAAALANLNFRVLLVDLDDQANLTFAVGQSAGLANHVGAYMLATPAEARRWQFQAVRPNLWLLPSSDRLDESIAELQTRRDYATLLRKRLSELDPASFDYVVLDCPPSLTDGMTYAAFLAADGFVITTDPEPFSVRGLKRIMDRAEKVQQKLNPSLRFLGFVFTRFNPAVRGQLRHQMVATVGEKYGIKHVLPNIRQDSALSEAHTERQDIFTYEPSSRGAADYQELTHAILKSF